MATAEINEETDELLPRSKPPFLRRVQIRGYKSIAFCDVTLEPLTVLVGRNASGKSNFLDALAFLGDIIKLGVNQTVQQHGGADIVPNKFCADQPVFFEIDFAYQTSNSTRNTEFEQGSYSVAIRFPKRRPPEIIRESFNIKGLLSYQNFNGRVICSAVDEELQETSWHVPDRPFLDAYNDTPIPEFAKRLENIIAYGPIPDQIRRVQKPNPGAYLRRDASNLASVIRNLRESDPVTLKRVKQYVSHMTDVADFWDQSYGEYETVRFQMCSMVDGKPLELNADSMSDGTLRILAVMLAVFQSTPGNDSPSIVGIEEPETALHPGAMNALVDALDEATLRTQVLITTHSAELLDNPTIKPENVRVVQMVDGQTRIAPADAVNFEIVQRKLNTLGGLERENQLEPDFDDIERQKLLAKKIVEPDE